MANNAGQFSIGRADISYTAWVTGGTGGAPGAFTDIGHLEGDAVLEVDREDLTEGSEQVLGMLFNEPIKFGMRLKFAAKESTMDILGVALGLVAPTGSAPNKTLLISDPVNAYYRIKVATKGGRSNQGATLAATQTWTFFRCVPQKPEPLIFSKSKVRLFGFTFEVLYDESAEAGNKYGTVVNASGN